MKKAKVDIWMLISIIAGILIFVVVLTFGPKPLDWSQSYSKNDKIPFGNSLLYELLPEHFSGHKVVPVHSRISSFMDDTVPGKTNIIFITRDFEPNKKDFDKILSVLDTGNSVFVAASSFSNEIADTLKIKCSENFWINLKPNDSISFSFANNQLKKGYGYWYKKCISNFHFTTYDTLRTTVLGINNEGKTNFIRIRQGKGWLYLNLNPLAFTNYNLLINNNYEYVFKCLSYLPVQHTLWDEYYKLKNTSSQLSLGYILTRKPLRFAWYVLLFGILLFFVFQSRRTQRVIPIMKPPENTTLNFIETIGRLYFSRKNHLDIAQKRFIYFKEFVRNRYFINTSEINETTVSAVAQKSGIHRRAVKQLFDMGKSLSKTNRLSEEALEQFNRKIEYFYNNSR